MSKLIYDEPSIHWIVLFSSIIAGGLVVFQFSNIVFGNSKRNRHKFRYLILVIIFLFFNYMQTNEGFIENSRIQFTISIILCLYLVWYLFKEFDIRIPKLFFKSKNLIIFSALSFSLVFISSNYYKEPLNFIHSLSLIPSIFITLIFIVFVFFKNKTKRERYFRIQTFLGFSSILFISLLPILIYFVNYYQSIIHIIITLSFFLVTALEINSSLYRIKNIYKLNQDNANLFDLTNRENEIALQLIRGNSYKSIAHNMFISCENVKKHTSNIFSKSNSSNRLEFINKVG